MTMVIAAQADAATLNKQLIDQVTHLGSAIYAANAQIVVARQERASYHSAFEEATKQLSASEAEANRITARLVSKEAELQVRLIDC